VNESFSQHDFYGRGLEETVIRYIYLPFPENLDEAKVFVERANDLLRRLNHAYYDLDAPLAEDADYDRLLLKLQQVGDRWPELIQDDSPTRVIGGSVSEKFASVPHRFPMLSLLDVFSYEAIEDYVDKIRREEGDIDFLVEMKIDGLSVSLTYENGRLLRAVTRGDGVTSGEDITENILEIQSIPHILPEAVGELVVRGEVFMSQKSFESLNASLKQAGSKLFANPRNAASGTMRQLDASVVRERDLSFFAFDVQHASRRFEGDRESLMWLSSLSIPVIPKLVTATTATQIIEAIENIGQQREHLPFGIDGAVIKIDSMAIRERMGETVKYPRWALAYKYPPEQKDTKILDIQAQVGRTGRITPLAILEPVILAGTTVQRATLHNQAYIDQLDVRIGDSVRVEKAGDIIPQVIFVNPDKRPEGTVPYRLPEHCPRCGSQTEYTGDGADLFCINADCPAQLIGHLVYFASKDAMDIDGLGEKAALALTESGYVHSIADLYTLWEKREALIESGIVGREKGVDNLLAAIEASKAQPTERLLTGLGIPLVGRQTARALLKTFPDLHLLQEADEMTLSAVRDIGPVTAREIKNWFSLQASQNLLSRLEASGLQLTHEIKDDNQRLSGSRYVITGTLESMTREEAKEALEALGAQVSGSVSAKTTAVIIGENPGSKAARAYELQVPVMDEEAFLEFLQAEQGGEER
jgi:DNA ligase (NAD+)